MANMATAPSSSSSSAASPDSANGSAQAKSSSPALNAAAMSTITGKPLREMIARGAACNTCRARKVKCDAVRPICNQCHKSSRGDAALAASTCGYDGRGSVSKQTGKRARGHSDEAENAKSKTSKVSAGSNAAKSKSSGAQGEGAPDGGKGRVASLMERISELERRIATTERPPSAEPQLDNWQAIPGQPSAPSSSLSSYSTSLPVSSIASLSNPGSLASSLGSRPAIVTSDSYPTIDYGSQPASWAALSSLSNAASLSGSRPDSFASSSGATDATTVSPSDSSPKDFLNGSAPADAAYSDVFSFLPSPPAASPPQPVLHPSWPSSLPSPHIVLHLVGTFFRRATFAAGMFDQARLLSNLRTHGPQSAEWPETALLHAMMAYAAPLVSEESLRDTTGIDGRWTGPNYWDPLREGGKSPRTYHYEQATIELEKAMVLSIKFCSGDAAFPAKTNWRGQRMPNSLQLVQTHVLCALLAYQLAILPDLWRFAGAASRLCVALDLNHIPPWDYVRQCSHGDDSSVWLRQAAPSAIRGQSLLAPAKSLVAYHERVNTFWMVFSIDRQASASTYWATSLDERDITTHLPCYATEATSSLLIDPHTARIPALSHASSPEVFFAPAEDIPLGYMGLYFKANVLLGRVVTYLGRLPRLLELPPGVTCAQFRRQRMDSDDFRAIEFTLARFRKTVSAHFNGVTDDPFLSSAFTLPHLATLLLYEPFTDRHDRSESSALSKCLISSKCIYNALTYAASTSNDYAGWDPMASLAWATTGRILVRDSAIRALWTDDPIAQQASITSRSMALQCIQFVQMCMSSGLTPVASGCLESLREMLDNPEGLLPIEDGEMAVSRGPAFQRAL